MYSCSEWHLLHEATSCLVAVVNVYDIANRRATKIRRNITVLQNQFQSLEDIFPRVSPLLNILASGNNPGPQNLDITCRHLDSIATEVCKRAVADKNAILFNVPESLQLKTVKLRLLDACKMSHNQCYRIRLRKNCNSTTVRALSHS